MAISPQKLLPQSGETGIRLSSSIIKQSNLGVAKGKRLNLKDQTSNESGGKLVLIYDSLVNINQILNKRNKDSKEQVSEKKQEEDKREKKQEEDKLELKTGKKKIDLPKIQNPAASFFDRLKNALVLLFVGWLVNRFFDYIPKILEGVSNFIKTLEDIRKFLKPATDALGSALYNVTLTGTKMLGAITGANIDNNEKNLAVAINELDKKFSIVNALMAGVIIGDIFSAVADGLDLFERPGRGGPGGVRYQTGRYRNGVRTDQYNGFNRRITRGGTWLVGTGNILEGVRSDRGRGYDVVRGERDIMRRYFQRFGRNKFIQRFGEQGLEALPRNLQRGFFQQGARNVGAFALRGARNVFGRGAVRVAGKVFGRIPIIGGLIDFIINLAMGEPVGRAAAKAVGSTVGAALGTLIPIPFAGTILGGFLGDLLGGAVYDMLAPKETSKKPQTKKGKEQKTEKPKGYFFGGLVSGIQNFFSSRSVTATKPSAYKGTSQKLAQKTTAISPTVQSFKVDSKIIDRIGREVASGFVGVSSLISNVPFVGPLAALGINLALSNQRFSKSSALGIAAGIGNLLGNPLSSAIFNFFDNVMPGLGNFVQKVVGNDFGIFLSNWITQFLGQEIYKALIPQLPLIKMIMEISQQSAKKVGEKPTTSAEDEQGTPLGSGETATAKSLLDGLVKRGFSKEEAAAIVGNLFAESTFRTGASNPTSGAYGLMQWTGGRKSKLINFAKEKGKPASDLETQLDYIRWELAGGNQYETAQFAAAMASGSTVSEKTRGFAEKVERASPAELNASMKKRIGAAQSAYGQGGGRFTETNLRPANIKPTRPQSRAATAYPGVSQFASYDRPSTRIQPIRQVVYVPMGQQQSGGVVMLGGGGVNNTDYQIAAIKAAL
jgi:hypothetical protein